MPLSVLIELLIGEVNRKTYTALSPVERERLAQTLMFLSRQVAPKADVFDFRREADRRSGVLEDLKNRATE